MKKHGYTIVLAFAASAALSTYLVHFYNHWYFGSTLFLKWLVGLSLLLPCALTLLHGSRQKLWRGLSCYFTVVMVLAALLAPAHEVWGLGFAAVLNLEVLMVWLPLVALGVHEALTWGGNQNQAAKQKLKVERVMELRARLRRSGQLAQAMACVGMEKRSVLLLSSSQDGATAEQVESVTAEQSSSDVEG